MYTKEQLRALESKVYTTEELPALDMKRSVNDFINETKRGILRYATNCRSSYVQTVLKYDLTPEQIEIYLQEVRKEFPDIDVTIEDLANNGYWVDYIFTWKD